MASLTAADNAIKALHNQKVMVSSLGPIQVKYAQGEAEKLGLPVDPAQTATFPPSEAKLFVGMIRKNASEDEVRAIFTPFGTITEIFMMKEQSGESKGCAFVKYAYKEQALLAINKLNGQYHMDGAPRPMEVRFAESKRQMQQNMMGLGGMGMVGGVGGMGGMGGMGMGMGGMGMGMGGMSGMGGGLMGGGNNRQIGPWREYFTADGKRYYFNEKTGMSQWDGPKEFMNGGMGMGMAGMGGMGGMGGMPGMIPPGVAGSDAAGPPGANVFIVHIPHEWGYPEFYSAFSSFGRIISCKLSLDQQSQRNKGNGFISFDNVNSAVQCVSQMNGVMCYNKKLSVSVKKGEEQHVAHLLPAAAGHVPNQQGMGITGHIGGAMGGAQPPSPPGAMSGVSRAHQNFRFAPY
eukprot:GHVN01015447.1.p1 GENE.GHVN01015447.1~~GHVN01015447.1.p1  ORF type:complete len:443 (-),score=61.72 GHVN01015447.1:1819-3030(-)